MSIEEEEEEEEEEFEERVQQVFLDGKIDKETYYFLLGEQEE